MIADDDASLRSVLEDDDLFGVEEDHGEPDSPR